MRTAASASTLGGLQGAAGRVRDGKAPRPEEPVEAPKPLDRSEGIPSEALAGTGISKKSFELVPPALNWLRLRVGTTGLHQIEPLRAPE
jgi:hypothetical protein